jgi:2Fe-2S ferredoxin
MGGENPFIQDVEARLPTQRYTVTFLPMGETVEVDPEELPYGRDGRPGSILDIALAHGIDLDHACGGVCACSTCHVYVTKGANLLSEQEDDEADILDKAFDVRANSRLGCQARIEKDGELEVEITRESHDAYFNEHPDERKKP